MATGSDELKLENRRKGISQKEHNEAAGELVMMYLKSWATITYGVFGLEIGEEGTAHLQGYLEFKDKTKFSTLNHKLESCHNKSRHKKATAKDASDYCKKGEQPHKQWEHLKTAGKDYGKNAIVWEWGEISNQGARSDISDACADIIEQKPWKEVATNNCEVFVKYHKGLVAFKAAIMEPRKLKAPPVINVYYGGTGCGKSKRLYEEIGTRAAYVWSPQQKHWFDGYDFEKIVGMEEFRGQLPFGGLLLMTDRNQCRLEYKGGTCQLQADEWHFTSPVHPSEWYKMEDLKKDEKLEQLSRRITSIYKCTLAPGGVKYEGPFEYTLEPWDASVARSSEIEVQTDIVPTPFPKYDVFTKEADRKRVVELGNSIENIAKKAKLSLGKIKH